MAVRRPQLKSGTKIATAEACQRSLTVGHQQGSGRLRASQRMVNGAGHAPRGPRPSGTSSRHSVLGGRRQNLIMTFERWGGAGDHREARQRRARRLLRTRHSHSLRRPGDLTCTSTLTIACEAIAPKAGGASSHPHAKRVPTVQNGGNSLQGVSLCHVGAPAKPRPTGSNLTLGGTQNDTSRTRLGLRVSRLVRSC